MMHFLYFLGIHIYHLSIRLAALFSTKARLWVNGRKNVLTRMALEMNPKEPLIWFHCASLGEFEQGRPVIESVRKEFPNHKILLTFFSPSGYEVRKNYSGADYIYYLPVDTASNARRFIEIAGPQLAFFVKYEFWFNYVNELHRNNIPLISFSAIFRPSQHFFKYWGSWFAKQLNKVSWFFVQNASSLQLLREIHIHQAAIGGDTRFDRVSDLVKSQKKNATLELFKGDADLLLAGSTWLPDEQILLELLQKLQDGFKLVIAPHLIDSGHIHQIQRLYKSFDVVLYSETDVNKVKNAQVMVIDSMGHLSTMYSYAKVAYIGGGFGVGIHNLLEAAAYGKPVIFGPNHRRFREAVELTENGAGFPIHNAAECMEVFERLMKDEKSYQLISLTAKNYVQSNAGATKKVVEKAKEYIPIA